MIDLARFFSRFRSRDKPVNRTAGSSFTFYMGGSSSGKHVNERSAMQMTAVYACVRILSEAVAGLPLHLYRYNDSGGKEKRPTIRCTRSFTMSRTRRCRRSCSGKR